MSGFPYASTTRGRGYAVRTLRNNCECKTNISTGSRAMRKGNFVIGQRVRLKWELEPPASIPAGAIGQVTRVSPWDVWVRFEKRVVRVPFSELEHSEKA